MGYGTKANVKARGPLVINLIKIFHGTNVDAQTVK